MSGFPRRSRCSTSGLRGRLPDSSSRCQHCFSGSALSTVEALPEDFAGMELGEPLLFRAAAWLVWGDVPDGMSINMHPMAFAAWFGLLATALNLFPIGQLDGGHVAYAVLGRRSAARDDLAICRRRLVWCLFQRVGWSGTILMLVMLFVMGPHHPPTLNDEVRMDRARLAASPCLALFMLIVCFTPAPLEPFVMGQ